MAQSGSVIARIVSQYSPKGTAAARKDLKRMEKQVSDIGKKIAKGFAAAGAAVSAFAIKVGKESIEAVMADQKAQQGLAIALRNLTGATDEVIDANSKFLDSLELQVAIDNEKLIPALQKLVTSTGNLQEAQLLLSLSTDVAAASGKDLDAVSTALAKAVQGNFTALTRLGIPLDKNAVKAKDLGKILVDLSKASAGQATAAANTLAGRMELLRIKFGNIAEDIGYALLPALLNIANVILNDVIPQIQEFVFLNEAKLVEAFRKTIKGGQDVAKVLVKIYNVIKGVNDILPLGLAGWLQLAIGLKIFGVAASALISIFSVIAVKLVMQKDLIKGITLSNQEFVKTLTQSSSNSEKFLRVLYKLKAMYGATTFATSKLGTAIYKTTAAVKALSLALLRSPLFWAAAAAMTLGYAFTFVLKKMESKKLDKFNEAAGKVEYSMYKASKGIQLFSGANAHLNKMVNLNAESMDDAHNKYKKQQLEKSKLTKDEIANQKLLAEIEARRIKEEKINQLREANYKRLNAELAKRANVSLLSSEDQKIVQINAALALAERQKEVDKANKERLKDLKEEILLQKVRLDLSKRYQDILKVLADGKIDTKEIAILAKEWGISKQAVKAYLLQLEILEDAKITNDEIIELAKTWGSTQAQAAQYLDFLSYLNDGVLSDAEIEKLKSKWNMTTDEVRMYADFVGIVNDGKLEDKEITKIKDKWNLTTKQVSDYILKIGSPVTYSGTLYDPADFARNKWLSATEALERYLKLLGMV